MKPVIFGLADLALTADERAFFAEAEPLGYILFKRNVVDPAQLRALTDSLRALTGRDDLPILVDQEGGRVVRLGPPHWPTFPAGPLFDRLYQAGKVVGFAMQIYRDEEKVREFLTRRHPMLEDRTPLDVALESGVGADMVVNLLGRGAYGGGA